MTPDTTPDGTPPSQRALAAIVFTDVVSFSARMHADEVQTLALLQRDFAEMRRLCTEHEGNVLKTTGDGLLLTFTSAVQAVACALAMQRQFAAEAKDPGGSNALQHRIGIHLGDVLMQDKDVMGDGVNIAARLQSEAEPGGICISQTVYDVVKNKIQMQAVSLGARDLKNIAQAMPVYRLLLEAHGINPGGKGVPMGRGGQGRSRRNLWKVSGSIAGVVAIAAFLFFRSRPTPASPAPSIAVAPTPVPTAVAAPTPLPTIEPKAPDIARDLADEDTRRKDAFADLHALYLDKYDFNGLVVALRDKGEIATAPPELKQTLRSAEQLVRLKSWLETTLRHYDSDHPLLSSDLSGDATKDVGVYLAADERIVFMESGNPVARDWADIKPAEMGAIIVGAFQAAKDKRRLPILAALTFARLYALPQMPKALALARSHDESAVGK